MIQDKDGNIHAHEKEILMQNHRQFFSKWNFQLR